MLTDNRDKRERNYIIMRSVMDYGMGLVIFSFGVFLFFSDRLGFDFQIEPFFRYFFAGMCLVYGAWRMFRGYKKSYIRHDEETDDEKIR
jgi:hypothetical protein